MDGYVNPFMQGGPAHAPGSVPDHPGAPLLPPFSHSSYAYGSSSTSSSYGDWSLSYHAAADPLPPPPDWMLQPPAQQAYGPPPPLPPPRPVNIVLPPFRASRPTAWFAAVEDVFQLRGVVDQRDMFAYGYAALGEEQLLQVDDLVEMRPRPPDAFYRLRDRLVATHSMDSYLRLEQLLNLPPLGGQKPSVLLAQMRQLCPPGEENTMFFRGVFLQRLPLGIRMQLAEDRLSPVQALALIVHHSFSSVAAVSSDTAEDLVAAMQGDKQQWRKKGRGKAPPPSGRGQGAAKGEKPWEKLGICRQHYRYGAEAWDCHAPCAWASGN
jgi:hypothetical protein